MPRPARRERSAGRLSDAGIDTLAIVSRFYYFHLVNGDVRVKDRIGVEVDEESVMSRAVVKIVKERWPGTSDAATWQGWSVEIVDTQGRIIRTVALDDLN
jgi:hypothetical protein